MSIPYTEPHPSDPTLPRTHGSELYPSTVLMALASIFHDFNISENSKALLLLADANTPFLDLFQVGQSNDQNKHIRYEETALATEAALGANINSSVLTGIAVPSTFTPILSANMVIQISDEQMIIAAVDTAGNTFSVKARGHAGTAATSHTAGDTIVLLGKAEPEGILTDDFVRSPRTMITNYFQELTEDVYVTARAARKMHKDYIDMLGEERTAKAQKMLSRINALAMNGFGAYDTVAGQNTTKGLRALVGEQSGLTQSTFGYSNGAFALSNRTAVQRELLNRNSSVDTIVTNAVTKKKLLGLVGSAYATQLQSGVQVNAGVYFDGIVAEDRDGRILKFVVDNSVKGSSLALVDSKSLHIIPAKDNDGGDLFMKVSTEAQSSAVIQETIRSITWGIRGI